VKEGMEVGLNIDSRVKGHLQLTGLQHETQSSIRIKETFNSLITHYQKKDYTISFQRRKKSQK